MVHLIQIRDFEHNPETQESRKQELEKLMQDQETFRSSLLQWCYTSYGEVLPSYYWKSKHFWMHFLLTVNYIHRHIFGAGFKFEMLCSLEGNEKVNSFVISQIYI